MNSVINKYLIFGFLKTILNFLLVFICLGVILNLFEEIEFFKNLDTNFSLPFLLTLVFIPNEIIKLLPFVIFFASMWYLISIKTNSDLISLKVFGYSNLKIISILSITSFLFGVLIIFVINPITSVMIKYYEETKAQYSKDTDHLVSINKNGVWIKEIEDDTTTITTAKKLEENFMYEVTIYKINNKNKIETRIGAKKADITNKTWVLSDTTTFSLNDLEKPKEKPLLEFKSSYNISKLNSLYKNLDTISFYSLLTEYQDLNSKGYSKETLNEKLNIFFSMPVFLLLMVVLASIFTVGGVNKQQNLYYIFISFIKYVR